MKALLALALLAAAAPTAHADNQARYQNLMSASQRVCHVPEHEDNYELGTLRRFHLQIVDPSYKMTNTAFVVGFATLRSANIPIANCLVVFMGQPNDPVWEKGFSFYDRAKETGTVPAVVFSGQFDSGDQPILVPFEKPVN